MRKLFYSISILALVAYVFLQLCQAQTKDSKPHNKIELQLVAKYKLNELYDISSDGKLFLLYGPSTPVKDSKSKLRTEWKPKEDERYSKVLRVVEWETGRELAKVKVEYLHSAGFAGDNTSRVCFNESENKLWNYSSGHISKCDLTLKPAHYVYRGYFEKYDSPNSKYKVEASLKKSTNFLFLAHVRGVITIYDRSSNKKLGMASHPIEKLWAENISAGRFYGYAMTSDEKFLITYYGFDTYVWSLDN